MEFKHLLCVSSTANAKGFTDIKDPNLESHPSQNVRQVHVSLGGKRTGMIINEELWTSNYLIYRLKEHLGTVPISSPRNTDLLDWYLKGHQNKVIDFRKYYNQVYHYLKIGALKTVPKFLVSLSELSPLLVKELADFEREDRHYIVKQAVALIFQEINSELYHNSIARTLEVQLVA